MIGIGYIRFLDALHICGDIARQAPSFREPLNDRSSHLLPQQSNAVYVWRCFSHWQKDGRSIGEGIGFTHAVTCGRHRLPDLIRDAVAPAVAKSSCQTAGNRTATAFQKLREQAGSV